MQSQRLSLHNKWVNRSLALLLTITLILTVQSVKAATGGGVVVGWGDGRAGYLLTTTELSGIAAITAGFEHSLLIKNDGTLIGLGSATYGQTHLPAGLNNLTAIAAGNFHSLALKGDGTVVAWGRNDAGQSNIPAGLSNVTAIAGGSDYSLALKRDGTVAIWGGNDFGQLNIPAGLSNVIAIAAGSIHSLALKADGTVVGWGDNRSGQLNIPAGLSGVVAIEAGSNHSLALKGDGTVVAWGGNFSGQLNVPAGLRDVVAIVADIQHNLALKSDGTVVAWGSNSAGQSNVPTGLSDVVAIASGGDFNLALKRNGTVVSWGQSHTAAAMPKTVRGVVATAIAAGELHILALKPDGTVVVAGNNLYGQLNSPVGLRGVVAIAAGGNYSLALKGDGTVVAWGNNGYGQLNMPAGLNGVVAIAAGFSHALALKGDGTVVAWGSNTEGQTTIPTALKGVIAIAAGRFHSLALKNDGTVVAWGRNDHNQLNIPAALSGVVAIAAGDYANLALKHDGTVVAWGWDRSDRIKVPAGLSGVVAIAAGGEHSLALTRDGTVVAWGGADAGQINMPAGLRGVSAIAAGGVHSLAIVGDQRAPRANPSQQPATANGWNKTDVTIKWRWSDSGGSEIDLTHCTWDSTSSGEGEIEFTASCHDQVGNEGRAQYRVRVDKTNPTSNLRQNPPANANGWSNRDVSVDWRWLDSGSTIDPARCALITPVTSEGRTDLTQSCQDRAGNVASAVHTVYLDKTIPSASPTVSPAANANGWHNTDVTVTWGWSDPAAGAGQAAGLNPANCPATTTSSGEGSRTLNSTCSDLADNRATQNYTVKVDKSAPVVTVTGVSNGAVYTLGSVPTAACNTIDTLAGVATPAALTVTGGNGDGTGSFTATCSAATDLAGNSRAPVTATWSVVAAPAAQIEITSNQQPIANRSNSPTLANGTNLGEVAVGSSLDQSFTINNRGNGELTLNGSPVAAISGANATDFVVTTPPAGTVAAGGNTSFQVRFTPTSAGARTATLTIANNDSANNPYTFTIGGAGTDALQPTSQLTQLAGNSQSCTAATGTYVKNCTISFTLQNSSAEELQIRYYSITNVSSHLYVLNGTPNPGQIGTTVTDRRSIAQGSTFQPTFNLGLLTNTSYTIRFKVYGYAGVAAASADDSNGVDLGEFEVTIDPAADALPGAGITATQGLTTPATVDAPIAPPITSESSQRQQLFLPLITNAGALAGAAFGSPNGIAVLLLVGLVIGGLVYRRTRKAGKG